MSLLAQDRALTRRVGAVALVAASRSRSCSSCSSTIGSSGARTCACASTSTRPAGCARARRSSSPGATVGKVESIALVAARRARAARRRRRRRRRRSRSTSDAARAARRGGDVFVDVARRAVGALPRDRAAAGRCRAATARATGDELLGRDPPSARSRAAAHVGQPDDAARVRRRGAARGRRAARRSSTSCARRSPERRAGRSSTCRDEHRVDALDRREAAARARSRRGARRRAAGARSHRPRWSRSRARKTTRAGARDRVATRCGRETRIALDAASVDASLRAAGSATKGPSRARSSKVRARDRSREPRRDRQVDPLLAQVARDSSARGSRAATGSLLQADATTPSSPRTRRSSARS